MTELIDALRIEPISKLHNRKDFKCNKKPLTQYLHRYARQNDENNIAKTFVAVDGDNKVLGYYSLSTSSIEFEELPEEFTKRLPGYPIPAALIAKLAVDSDVDGQGLGSKLLIEALQNILTVSEEMAVKVVLVDAIDEEAKGYYLHFGFIELPEKADVILCELCDTGLIAELQVPVLNHALENCLKTNGKIIPYCAKTTMELVYTDYIFEGSLFKLMHYEAYGSRESKSLSDEMPYHIINFQEKNSEYVDTEEILTATSDGIVNGVRIKTYIRGAKELDYIPPSPWFNPPVILPTKEDIKLKTGNKVKINIKYILGGGWLNVRYNVEKI